MTQQDDRVSRRRYHRQMRAREEAEALLERKSRELFEANQKLSQQSDRLEIAVEERTQELREALEMAERASAARSRFIATMSHEIRTPLAGLLGMIDLLSLDETKPEKIQYLESAKLSGQSLNRIVNDVLDFSKMEAGLFVFENESVDIHALTNSVVMLARTSLDSDNRDVTAHIASDVPARFLGDATRIRQVLSNLVSNAVKFSDKGPIEVRLSAKPDPKGALIRIDVTDHGVGIPPERIGDLFKDFSQVSNSLTSSAQGTGLGLAISKRIVEGLGGTIGVTSELGQGSNFWVNLPVTVLEAGAGQSQTPPPKENATDDNLLHGKRVLLAEDNPINQVLLSTYLSRLQIECVVAENGRVAFETFAPGAFDLILMDVAMPEMDGLQATQTIRDTWPAQDVPPIIILTAHVMNAIEQDARRVGVTTVLSKPIPFATLEQALRDAFQDDAGHTGTTSPAADPALHDPMDAVIAMMDQAIATDLTDVFSRDKLHNLIEHYIAESRELLADITVSFEENRRDKAGLTAHSLKGSSRVLGFLEIADAAEQLEHRAKTLSRAQANDYGTKARGVLDQLECRLRAAGRPTIAAKDPRSLDPQTGPAH